MKNGVGRLLILNVPRQVDLFMLLYLIYEIGWTFYFGLTWRGASHLLYVFTFFSTYYLSCAFAGSKKIMTYIMYLIVFYCGFMSIALIFKVFLLSGVINILGFQGLINFKHFINAFRMISPDITCNVLLGMPLLLYFSYVKRSLIYLVPLSFGISAIILTFSRGSYLDLSPRN